MVNEGSRERAARNGREEKKKRTGKEREEGNCYILPPFGPDSVR
jgi:hypothetical protein